MRSKSYIFLLIVLGLAALSGFLYSQTKYNFGLDVKGGVRFTYQMDLTKLKPEQKAKIGEIRSRLLTILSSRATGALGVAEPTVLPKGTDQFVIELPGFTDIEKARQAIGTSARIEFYHARNVVTNLDSNRRYTSEHDEVSNPPTVNFVKKSDPTNVIKYGTPEYADVIKDWGEPILAGEELDHAETQVGGSGGYQPLMIFSSEGGRKMENWCRRYSDQEENIAEVLDGRVLSIAPLKKGAILRENAVIEGNFKPEYVRNLVNLLNAGALPVDLVPLSSETVDPTIGTTALDAMVLAGLVAFGVTCVFLVVYYAFPGFVAVLALSLYVLFTLTVLKLMGATFSLAAIAGFILGVGMAVDANILVFERFREEMKAGKSLSSAINLGFKRALPAIVDSNACTIITSVVLFELGTGPVKGFATTLIVGVLISLFTAVTVTRSLLVFFIGSGIVSNPKAFAVDRNWFHKIEMRADHEPLHVVNKWGRWFGLSLLTMIVGIPFVFMGGLKPNVEFRGGYEAVFAMTGEQVSSSQILANLAKSGYDGANVKFGTYTPQDLVVTVPKSDKLDAAKTDDDKKALVSTASGLKPESATAIKATDNGSVRVTFTGTGGLSLSGVIKNLETAGYVGSDAVMVKREGELEKAAYITIPPNDILKKLTTDTDKIQAVAKASGLESARSDGFTEIGAAIQAETLQNAIKAVLLSSALIIVFLALRFGMGLGGFAAGLRFGVSAIGALLHDIIVVMGVTAIVGYVKGWEISALFITSMLTIIGFSVHDTIVIFDRIRENLHRIAPGEDMGHLMNRSITQSFARSINTSMTVIFTLIVLLGFGTTTPDLKLFCATMLAGIISGTYSSIYNASPILYLWDLAAMKKKGAAGTLVGIMKLEQQRTAVITTRAATSESVSTASNPNASQGGRSYGQVRRRANDATRRASVEMDDEE